MTDITPSSSSYGPRGWDGVIRPVAVIFIGLGLFIVLPTILLARLAVHLDIRGRTLVGLGGTLVAELILFGFLLRWLKGQARSLAAIGWARPTTIPAIMLGVIFALAYASYTLTNPLIKPNAAEISLFKLAGIFVGVAGAIIEESVFRGYLISELERIHVSTLVQILVSGASFAVIHIGFDWVGVFLTFIMGTVLATAYVIGKRSLTPSILSHATINILIEPWLLLFIITMYSRIGQAITR